MEATSKLAVNLGGLVLNFEECHRYARLEAGYLFSFEPVFLGRHNLC